MRNPTIRKVGMFVFVVLSCFLFLAAPVAAEWMGDYLPWAMFNYWTYENVNIPGDIYTDSIFEVLIYEGDQAAKFGEPDDYVVAANTGRTVTVYAETEDGELVDFEQNIVIGEFSDGGFFEICHDAGCDTNLIRDWEAIDPALRDLFDLDPSYTEVILIVSYDRDFPPNFQNGVASSNLPAGVTPPTGAVTGLEWYQRDLGMIAITDVDAASGGLIDFYQLVDWLVPVDDQPSLPVLVRLGQNYPNPFNPRTTISYTLTAQTVVSLEIRDLAGRRVRTLEADTPRFPGRHTITWDGLDIHGRPQPSGTYLYELHAGSEIRLRPMTLLR